MLQIEEAFLAEVISRTMPDPFGDDTLLHSPGGPRLGNPDPHPWRELAAFVRIADALEVAMAGAGARLLSTIADDPDDWCPTRPKTFPPKPRKRDAAELVVFGAGLLALTAQAVTPVIGSAGQELGARLMNTGSNG
jgi:hypothetical protein